MLPPQAEKEANRTATKSRNLYEYEKIFPYDRHTWVLFQGTVFCDIILGCLTYLYTPNTPQPLNEINEGY